jgi:hypothetical protein
LIDSYYKYFCLFHGSIGEFYKTKIENDSLNGSEEFEAIILDFTQNFNKYFF